MQGRSLPAGDAGNIKVEISCLQYGGRSMPTPAEWTQCVGITDGPPSKEETHGKCKGWEREREVEVEVRKIGVQWGGAAC